MTTQTMEPAVKPLADSAFFAAPAGNPASSPGRAASSPPPAPLLRGINREVGSVLDTIAAVALLFTVWVLTNVHRMPEGLEPFLAQRITVKNAILVGGFVTLWPRLLSVAGLYETGPLRRREDILRVFAACTIGSALAFAFPLASISGSFRYEAVIFFWIGCTASTLAIRAPLWMLAATSRTRVPRRVLVVGSGPRAVKLADEIQANSEKGYELIGYADSNDHAFSSRISAPKLGSLEELEEILMHQVVDEVLIALPIKSCYAEIQHTIDVCGRVGVESKYLADAFQVSLARPRFEHDRALPVMTMKVFHDDYRVSVKRAVDFLGSLVGLILLAPVLAAIAVAIKTTSKGPVFFMQERYGLNKRRFKMFKFRTMVPNAEALLPQLEDQNEAIGPAFKIRNDPRVTPVGRFLRKTSLDELPQLVNVLLGQMSLVGPRPMAVRDVQLFDQAWFMRRFSAPPGITGLWQVSGRSNLGFDDWVALDLKYIDEWSLVMDMRILAKTIPSVVRGVGAV
ncbi:MAG TPA: sugar transferase [Longimicrobium sp.]